MLVEGLVETLARRAISGIVSPARPFSATIAAVASTIRSRWLLTMNWRGRSLRPLGRRPSARRARCGGLLAGRASRRCDRRRARARGGALRG